MLCISLVYIWWNKFCLVNYLIFCCVLLFRIIHTFWIIHMWYEQINHRDFFITFSYDATYSNVILKEIFLIHEKRSSLMIIHQLHYKSKYMEEECKAKGFLYILFALRFKYWNNLLPENFYFIHFFKWCSANCMLLISFCYPTFIINVLTSFI